MKNIYIALFLSIFLCSICIGEVKYNNKSISNDFNLKKNTNQIISKKIGNSESILVNKLDLRQYSIILSDNASLVEKNAGNQLFKHLKRYGVLKVNYESENISGPKIYLGNTQTFKNKYGSINKYVGRDGVIIKHERNDIFINGERDRAILYAVYEFLEQFIGVRFWSPEVTFYPISADLNIDSINYIYTPQFYYRGGYSHNANTSIEFAAILKENGDFQQTDNNWGKTNKILGWVHTFNTILPYDKYGKLHPEWFLDPETNLPMKQFNPKLDGMLTQPYFYNEDMKKQFVINTLKWISENPSYDIISISSNDNKLFTKPKNSSENSADVLLGFLNNVAAEVKKIYPNKKIETLAHHATEIPPKKIKSAPNLIVRIAPITSNMGYAYNSPINLNPYKRYQGWLQVKSEKFYWGYDTNFKYPILPYPSFGRIGKDLELMKNNNFTGIFIQDNLNPNGYFQDMKTWVLSKLMWNPNLDQKLLIKEFFNGYYGEASEPLYQYYKLVEKTFISSSRILAAYQEDYKFLNQKGFLDKAENLFVQALNRSKSKEITERINSEKLSFDALNAYLGNLNDNQIKILIQKIDNKIVNRHERATFNNFSKVLKANKSK